MSLRGYCRTFSDEIAWRPAIKITRLTTSARTGRRMKRSVKVFTKMESTVGRFRRELRLGREFVVDDDVHAVAQFKDAGAYDLLARFCPVRYGDEIAAGFSGPDKSLAQNQRFLLRFFIRLFFNHENR